MTTDVNMTEVLNNSSSMVPAIVDVLHAASPKTRLVVVLASSRSTPIPQFHVIGTGL